MQIISKLSPISTECCQFMHPWTPSCLTALEGTLAAIAFGSVRIYTIFYFLTLLTKRRIPTFEDIKHTISRIVRTCAFATINFTAIFESPCLLDKLFRKHYIATIAFLPTLLISFVGISIEHPSRRFSLTLYTANMATEILWKMLVSRNIVRSIKHGQVAIFASSVSVLIFCYKSGLIGSDLLVEFLVGRHEKLQESVERSDEQVMGEKCAKAGRYLWIDWLKRTRKHETCLHPYGCAYYVAEGAGLQFSKGLAIQLALRVLFNLAKLAKRPRDAIGAIVNHRDIFSMGLFLGGFSATFRAFSCILRHFTETNHPYHAIPSALAAGIWFVYFPNVTAALYLMWKTIYITYNIGIDKGRLPKVPRFMDFLYAISAAISYHCFAFEPEAVRSSILRYLNVVSGGRLACTNRAPFALWGLNTKEILDRIIERSRIERAVQFPHGIFGVYKQRM